VKITRGGTFSYYEFVQPMSDRLTDEAWRDMLDQGLAPSFPDWSESFIVGQDSGDQNFLVASTKHEV
ncbi:MAG: DUF3160 domain-containing protein, partial [Candidatus Thorarchaeota archaeon]